jgi:hypothetical protein
VNKLAFVLISSLSLVACKKKESTTEAPPAGKAVTDNAAPAAAGEPAKAAPAASSEVDLSPGGAAWKGWTIKAPAETKVSDNGAGGISVLMGNFGFEMTQGDLEIKTRKDGIASGLEFSKGKVTYQVDKPDELAYTTETPAGDGTIKGYGFAMYVTSGGTKIGCSAMLDEEAQVAAAKAACASATKK